MMKLKTNSAEDIQKNLIKQASRLDLRSEEDLHRLKKKFSHDFKVPLISNWNLQKAYESLLGEGWEGDPALQKLIRKRKIRTLSGISVITVLTKPFACPGKCVFCPSEPGMPKSYLSNEPGAMRAVLGAFDGFDQVSGRINSLKKQGHETDKIEMIVLGGTFSAYPKRYQRDFIRSLYNACNGTKSKTLEVAQKINESATHRIIGLSVETRPDHINPKELKWFRELGVTKVQMGMQHTDNGVLDLNKRGEHIEDHIRALRLLKDAGFKIAVHLMPNLPGSTPEMDKIMVKEVFEKECFKPDQIKLYPCVVTPYSELEQWWKEGRYKSYSDEILSEILLEMKSHVPEFIRIERLFRDIPGESILEGSQKTNLRQLLHDRMKKKGVKCRCIRCREIRDEVLDPEHMELQVLEYKASEGTEFFISMVDTQKDKICALLRLRFPSIEQGRKKHFIPELTGAALVRELHTYGQQISLGKPGKSASQHVGLGRKMMEKAESLAKSAGFKCLAVISGIGVRAYYKKLGYSLEGTYMVKDLS